MTDYAAIRMGKRVAEGRPVRCEKCEREYSPEQCSDDYHEYRVDSGTGHSGKDPCYAVKCPEGHSVEHHCD